MELVPTPKIKSPLIQAIEDVARPAAKPCVVGTWLDSLDPDDRAYIDAQSQVLPKGTVFRAVSQFADCSSTSWNRHFGNSCSCPKIGTVNA